jgi:hypothetical protein
MKDKEEFVWVCFVCGNKRKANIKDAQRLKLAESFDGIGFDMGRTFKGIEPMTKPLNHEVKDSFKTKSKKKKRPKRKNKDKDPIIRLIESGQVLIQKL